MQENTGPIFLLVSKLTNENRVSPVQTCPSPEYPGLQEQLYDPSVLMHTAPALQLNVSNVHSSTSKKERKVCLVSVTILSIHTE